MISGRSEPDAVMQPNGELIYGIHRTPEPGRRTGDRGVQSDRRRDLHRNAPQ